MSKDSDFHHIPVLFAECMEALAIRKNGVYLDGTAGGGGHSAGILERLGREGRLLSLDRDEMALEAAEKKLRSCKTEARFDLIHRTFSQVDKVLEERKIEGLDGVLLDLGVSSAQLDIAERGFSYMKDGALDMRMNQAKGETAAEWLAQVSEDTLAFVLRAYGEERYAGRIAHAICREREIKAITQTTQLAELICRTMPPSSRREKQHPAKRSFQAIRIAVNHELDELETFLEKIPFLMNPQGRIAVISFHSLEDRRVKTKMREWEKGCICPSDLPLCCCGRSSLGKALGRKGLVAGPDECARNPRSRSARLRVFERNAQSADPAAWKVEIEQFVRE